MKLSKTNQKQINLTFDLKTSIKTYINQRKIQEIISSTRNYKRNQYFLESGPQNKCMTSGPFIWVHIEHDVIINAGKRLNYL